MGIAKKPFKELEKGLLLDLEMDNYCLQQYVKFYSQGGKHMATRKTPKQAKLEQFEKEIQKIEKAMEALDTVKMRMLLNEIASLPN